MKTHTNLTYSSLIGTLLTALVIMASSCSDMNQKLQSIPTAIGKTNEIIVVADDGVWSSAVRDTMDYYFGSAYPIMPSPEPIFDLRHMTPEYLNNASARQELRTYIILADISNPESEATQMAIADLGEEQIRRMLDLSEAPTAKTGKNKWAKNQFVAYILGNGHAGLAESIKENFANVAAKINSHDRDQIEKRTYIEGLQSDINTKIRNQYGVDMKIPHGFKEAIQTDDFLWVRKDADKVTYNLLFHKEPYTDKSQLTSKNIQALRNQLGLEYIASETANSYMVINDQDLPVFDYQTEIDGRFAIELRGVWEMTEDFMGGPFFSWMILNQDQNELVFIDAFILAPGEDKRDFMQTLEFMVDNSRFVTGVK